MSKYLPIEDYPESIKEMTEALLKVRRQLRTVEEEVKYREAWVRRHGDVQGSNDKMREAHLQEILKTDPEYRGLKMRHDELVSTRDRIEMDHTLLRDQFMVIRLLLQEKISLAETADIS